jgi:putative DNA methylase
VTDISIKSPRKLIEVALPLDAINEASAREKSIRHGHPSTLHLWWARRPLAAARAVIFSQMVNDPSWKWELEHPGEVPANNLKASWAASRKRLFAIMEDLVKWENTINEDVLEKARTEILKSWRESCELNKEHPQAAELFNPDRLPVFHDPFAGGGALPLEAQRLGLEAYASDLNPVAVLINKAIIEIPPKFAGRSPVNMEAREKRDLIARNWKCSEGLAEDVRYYGQWMGLEAQKRIGHLYPPVEITMEMAKDRPDLISFVGRRLTVIAWIWTRTVKSPNPAFRHVDVPLASTFVLSSQAGKEAYVAPIIDSDRYQFAVKAERPPVGAKDGTKLSRGANFRCLMSGTPIEPQYIKSQGRAGHMSARLMAVVLDGPSGRLYLSPDPEQERIAQEAKPTWRPETPLPNDPRNFWTVDYGLTTFGDLFTPRQLVALTSFSDLVQEARELIERDAISAGLASDGKTLRDGGISAKAYAEAVGIYLAEAVSKITSYHCTLGVWRASMGKSGRAFGRQAIPMVWDYPECNPFAGAGGDWEGAVNDNSKVLGILGRGPLGHSLQLAAQQLADSNFPLISTDPPYYDNVGYADLSDFFYVWLRRSLKDIFPELFATVAVPKAEELVATPYRHGSKEKAEEFFLSGMTQAMHRLAEQAHPGFPITIYYAFKQSETQVDSGTSSSGWETFLDAVIRAGLSIGGTWPMRTEQSAALKTAVNSLASSIVLVCRPRLAKAGTVSRRAFLRELNQVLPDALDEMTRGSGDDRSPVAPVDLSQAIIGPGMAVFSKYAAVLEADGTRMSVRSALQLINRFLAEDDFDRDTQFCLHWFEQYGWRDGKFGDADTLARAKGTSVDGVKHAGIVSASGGIVRLLRWSDYPADWNPESEKRLPVWEVLHQLIRVFKADGETGAGKVLAIVQAKGEATRQLAYRLHTLCERAGWPEDARAYNEIVTSWSAIEIAAAAAPVEKQTNLFG